MNKKADNTLIIYADKPIAGSHYFAVFLIFLFLAGALTWFGGLYLETEGYRSQEDTLFLIFLFLLAGFLAWRLWRRAKRILDIQREHPLVKINVDGVAVLGDQLKLWKDIEYLKLVNDFDQKYIELKCLEGEGNMNYRLHNPTETSEFQNLKTFKSILDRYTDKGLLEEH